eukprot:3647860-Alexandrium_andersonii.AAC.1
MRSKALNRSMIPPAKRTCSAERCSRVRAAAAPQPQAPANVSGRRQAATQASMSASLDRAQLW